MPPPASHMVKPNGWCSRPSLPSAVGVRPNSPPQITRVSSSKPRAFKSRSSAANGAIGGGTVIGEFLAEFAVLVPKLATGAFGCGGMINLHHAHAPLDQP